nr:hypothetical protein [Oceanicola granulosus]
MLFEGRRAGGAELQLVGAAVVGQGRTVGLGVEVDDDVRRGARLGDRLEPGIGEQVVVALDGAGMGVVGGVDHGVEVTRSELHHVVAALAAVESAIEAALGGDVEHVVGVGGPLQALDTHEGDALDVARVLAGHVPGEIARRAGQGVRAFAAVDHQPPGKHRVDAVEGDGVVPCPGLDAQLGARAGEAVVDQRPRRADPARAVVGGRRVRQPQRVGVARAVGEQLVGGGARILDRLDPHQPRRAGAAGRVVHLQRRRLPALGERAHRRKIARHADGIRPVAAVELHVDGKHVAGREIQLEHVVARRARHLDERDLLHQLRRELGAAGPVPDLERLREVVVAQGQVLAHVGHVDEERRGIGGEQVALLESLHPEAGAGASARLAPSFPQPGEQSGLEGLGRGLSPAAAPGEIQVAALVTKRKSHRSVPPRATGNQRITTRRYANRARFPGNHALRGGG